MPSVVILLIISLSKLRSSDVCLRNNVTQCLIMMLDKSKHRIESIFVFLRNIVQQFSNELIRTYRQTRTLHD